MLDLGFILDTLILYFLIFCLMTHNVSMFNTLLFLGYMLLLHLAYYYSMNPIT